jgi:hypothetical protein
VAEEADVSASTVARLLDTVSYSRQTIPDCIGIDEFKVTLIQENINASLLIQESTVFLIYYLTEDRSIFQLISEKFLVQSVTA